MAEKYVPSEPFARSLYMHGSRSSSPDISTDQARTEFGRFLARVRRDAAREALDGLMVHAEKRESLALTGQEQIKWRHVRLTARNYGRAHYPEPFTWTKAEDSRRLQSIADGAADHYPEETP